MTVTAVPEVPDFAAHGIKLLTDHGPGLRGAYLRIDRDRNELSLHDERESTSTLTVPLDQVAGVVRVSWFGVSRYSAWGRVLVVDHHGRVLAQTKQTMVQIFAITWTEASLAPTAMVLPDEAFKSSRRLQRAHPGAAPRWYLTTMPYSLLIVVAGILLILAVIFLATEGLG